MNGNTHGVDFVLADGEEVVKRYHCSTGIGNEGYLSVTTQRIVFSGSGTSFVSSRISSEVKLDSVSGISTSYGLNFNFPLLVVGIALALIGLISSSGFFSDLSIFFLIAGIVCVGVSTKKQFLLEVFSSQASGTPISVGQGPTSSLGNSAMFSLASSPTSETEKMIQEIGAMIYDLQNFGTAAKEKWKTM